MECRIYVGLVGGGKYLRNLKYHKVVTSEKVLVRSDLNGHAYSDMGGFGEVHGGFGIGQINDGRIRMLDWAVGKGLCLMNTCFQKRKSWLITFRSGETETFL